ncbi:GIY-YIG nuclease family protein, partial [Candidatus Parcubacteria bacterium]|nr:GIY-YIG nuclease family protein [Candidatus Parcubacteria bacterium]
MYYTYILKSKKSGRFYTGATNDLRKRLKLHNDGKSNFTKKDKPYDLIYYEACKEKEDAFAREIYLKSGYGKRFIKNRLRRFLTL